jgi:hypothetical protein
MNERVDQYVVAWGQNALALLVCLFIGSNGVYFAERAGWIYTRGWHTAWVTAVLFLTYLAWRDVHRDASTSPPERVGVHIDE